MHAAPHIVVLGIGNNLLADEGIGFHAVNRLYAAGMDEELMLVDGGTLGPALLEFLEHADGLIVIDAARLGLQPGAVKCCSDAEMDAMLQSGIRTVHELGLKDLLDVARLSGTLPPRRALIAVEPARIEWGTTLSSPVAGSLDRIVALVRELAAQWRQGAVFPA